MLILTLAAIVSVQGAAAASCESLATLKLPDTTITSAQSHAAGSLSQERARNLPGFCQVTATLRPTRNSEIEIDVWLPLSGWNGRLQAVGNGGWNGTMPYAAMAAALRGGYATVGTDTGHEGGGGPWMQDHEKLIDFGYRAVHEMTLRAKEIVARFYGSAARYAYFTGCSGGGRQALMEAQRYPDDFDGIVAGSPSLNATGRAAFSMWVAQNLRKEPASYIPDKTYSLIHKAVLAACDAPDGVADGVIENPARCSFDPRVLQCEGADSTSCLTAAQVTAARSMYQPLVDARTQEEIAPGLSYGSEPGWATFGGPQPFGLGLQMFQYLVFNDPKWDFRTLNFDSHMALVRTAEAGDVNAMEPNLKPFFASGGKLIQYHGWADPQIQPLSSVEYFDHVVQRMGGPANVKDNYRLFMVPGMAHCGGGEGTSTFDMLSALEQWVEQGRPPDSIPASRISNGHVDRTRPLCPYPQLATYKGGNIEDAANFVCR
jgi:Tannase and feruloyl esterase